jgi:hypothetical protein
MRGYSSGEPDNTVLRVSLIQLIAQPEKFDRKKNRFIGFLKLVHEGTAIYLHQEDCDRGIFYNAVWVSVPRDMSRQQWNEVNLQYVICEGVFRADYHGHMNMFCAGITEVRRLEIWPS